MEAVARELVGRNVLPNLAVLGAFAEHVPDEPLEMLLRPHDVLAMVQESRKLGAVVLVANKRVCLEHGFEPLDAYQLLTQAGGLSVAQMVNPSYTAVASCPRRYLRR